MRYTKENVLNAVLCVLDELDPMTEYTLEELVDEWQPWIYETLSKKEQEKVEKEFYAMVCRGDYCPLRPTGDFYKRRRTYYYDDLDA